MNMCFLPSESTLMPRSFKLYAYGSSSGHYFITSLMVKKCLFSALLLQHRTFINFIPLKVGIDMCTEITCIDACFHVQ